MKKQKDIDAVIKNIKAQIKAEPKPEQKKEQRLTLDSFRQVDMRDEARAMGAHGSEFLGGSDGRPV